ncbi:MAG: hypothetical protein EOO57_08230 [Hymenobacter sp.]|nr:MAG: hypothetical protein EOO57_08230 [Hymenobacter sp.]
MTDIDQSALDSLSVAPGEDTGRDPRQDAGRDKSIAKRLQKNPDSADARLDNALDESMDASDPPASTQPSANEPAPSSGFDEEAERKLRNEG